MEEQLRASWRLAVDSPGVDTGAAEDAFEGLLARYREPHRHYHTVKHLSYVLAAADDLMATVEVRDPHRVRLALFFHDAVYLPDSATNEADSAALARRVLRDLGVDGGCIEATAALIARTAGHEAPDDDPDAAVVLDADLAILAAEPSVYAAYVAGVRAEHAHLDQARWTAGRGAVLRHLLDRPAIFTTAPMRTKEPRARANLSAELVALER